MNNKQFQMKKIILSLAAGAVLGTAPAFADTDVKFGGDIIIRPFYRNNVRDFNNSQQDKRQFTTERTRLKANIKVQEDIGGVVELLHFRKWGAADPNRAVDNNGAPNGIACTTTAALATTCSAPVLDDNWLDLNQAYIEVKNLWDTGVYLRAGRQEMAYGDQRLVGNTNFWSTYPFPRAYDAVKIGAKYDTFDIDAWLATVTERQFSSIQSNAPSATPADRNFSGIWATFKNIPDNTLDLYLLNMDDGAYAGNAVLSQYEGVTIPPNFGHFPYVPNVGMTTADKAKVHNWGAKIKGKYSSLDYSLELNKQNGRFADRASINANGGAAVVGYTIPDAMGFRLSGEYVFASGDDNVTSGDHKTFYQFTPSPHMHLGAQDLVAFQNIKAWRLGGAFNPKKNLKLSVDYWNFKLDNANDYWYGSNGINTRGAMTAAVTGAGALNGAEAKLADRNLGSEVDLIGKYDYSPALSLELGYSVFNPGSGIRNATAANMAGHTVAGKGDTATFAWGMLMLKF